MIVGRPVGGFFFDSRRASAPRSSRGRRPVTRGGGGSPHGSFVLTGAAGGIGRSLVERLMSAGHVVALDLDAERLCWPRGHRGVTVVAGDEAVAAEAAERVAPLSGWVNNAAVFRDTALHAAGPEGVLELVALNLRPGRLPAAPRRSASSSPLAGRERS